MLRTLRRLFYFVNLLMQKIICTIGGVLLLMLVSCSSNNTPNPTIEATQDSVIIFPVTDFILGQIHEIDSMPVTPLHTITRNDKTDSIWIDRKQVRDFAAPFLTPVIDSISMYKWFRGKSFLDATLNKFTLTYEARQALPADISLRRWDVYINPANNRVSRLYLVKEEQQDNGELITRQLTWNANEWCSIRTIRQGAEGKAQVTEEKVTWKFK